MCPKRCGLRKQRQRHVTESSAITGADTLTNADANTHTDTYSDADTHAGRRDDFYDHIDWSVTEIADGSRRHPRHVYQQRHART